MRIDSAQRNLGSLEKVLEKIETRSQNVRVLREQLRTEINLKITQIERRARDLQQLAREPDQDLSADEAGRAAENILSRLSDLQKLISAAQTRATSIFCPNLDAAYVEHWNRRTHEFKQTITEGEARLKTINEPDVPIRTKWVDLRRLGDIWVDYLDYLTGLCVRHEGLDNDVCRIADALILDLQGSAEDLMALTIPGRENRAALLPKIVYLRFPEWTIWAVPLAAHELWHIAAEDSKMGRDFLGRHARNELNKETLRGRKEHQELYDDCLADVFATLTVGPAYACAALALGLDPMSSNDQHRARVILDSLLWMKGRDSISPPFEDIFGKLESMWKRALMEADQPVVSDDNFLNEWVSVFLTYLGRNHQGNNFLFNTDGWSRVRTDWTAALRDGTAKKIDMDANSLRYALNAGWKARIERPDAFKQIAERCFDLCDNIMRSRPSSTSSLGGGGTFGRGGDGHENYS